MCQKVVCGYCGTRQMDTGRCSGCGAGDRRGQERETVDLTPRIGTDVLFENGYVIWCVSNFAARTTELYFYLGDRLAESIFLDEEMIRSKVREGESFMPLAWEIFEAKQAGAGEKATTETLLGGLYSSLYETWHAFACAIAPAPTGGRRP